MNKIKSCKKNEKGYEINPITGKKRKSCLPHQLRNPKTGRCIKIIEDYEINPITGKKRKSCLPHQVRNPKTGRCIRKNKLKITLSSSSKKIKHKTKKSSSPNLSLIKLKNYIEDIKLFYDNSFTYTISSFKIFKTNRYQNDTFDFIKELFNFHRDDYINEIFYNKSNILGIIIIEGLYEEFEKLIDGIQIIKRNGGVSESKSNDDIIDCNTRKNDAFNLKTQHIQKLNKDQQQYLNIIIKTKLETFLKKITINRTTRKKFIKDSTINEIKKFIYYSVCIDSDIRKYIMRHYLLHFIKSEDFYNYSSKDKIDTSSDNEKNKEIIDRFLMNIGEFKKLPYINTDFTKDDDKKYIFTTCGETTLLNLLNYYFINNSGVFNAIGSVELLKFYSEYNTMKKQLDDIRKTTKAWLKVVSNLKKSEEKEKEVRLYNNSGDIHNNVKNIIFVLKTILGSKENEINKILTSISTKHNIEIISEKADRIEFSLDNYRIFFKPGHGDFIYKQKQKEKVLRFKTDDFSILYNNIFKLIDWSLNYHNELGKIILEILETNPTGLEPILKLFLTNLKILRLNHSDITELSPEIKNLLSLKMLFLNSNLLSELPESIGNLTNLETLNLNDNALQLLPYSIGNLTNLKLLDLGYNELEEFPYTIEELTNLERLVLNSNEFEDLPSEIGELTNLKVLVFNNNRLRRIPYNSIGNLTNLQVLNLNNNQLTTLPSEIGSLSSLKVLSLSYNQLTELPESIGSLSSLEELNLTHNELTTLPDSIGSLSSLKELSLSNNKLTTLPDSIGSLSSLKILFLYSNRIRTIPYSIGNLTNLETLNLNNNELEELPDSIGSLSSLKELTLSYNQLTTLPDSIGELTNLKVLYLQNNKFNQVPRVLNGFNQSVVKIRL